MDTNKVVAVFSGSECHSPAKKDHYFEIAYRTGKRLTESGFTVMNGAGPGLMEEVMRGAKEAGGKTIGIGISLDGRRQSPHITDYFEYQKLGPRQEKMIELADAYIALPGGVGTFFEILNIMALKRVAEVPVQKPLVLVDGYYGIMKILADEIVMEGFVDDSIFSYYKIAETPEDAIVFIKERLAQPATIISG